MSETIFSSFSIDRVRDLAQQAGYRVEVANGPAGLPLLRSAAGGIPFEVRLLSRARGKGTDYADLMFSAVLQVQGELSLDIVSRWNGVRRFGRLYLSEGHLVLAMDVVAVGGISHENLLVQIKIWGQLLQELVLYLRSTASELAAKNRAATESTMVDQPDHAVAPAA